MTTLGGVEVGLGGNLRSSRRPERTDRYPPGSADAADTTWALQRVQNQREQTQINRLLDVTNLVVSVLTDLPFLPRP